ncbi:MAG: cytochrome c [Nitrospira sp.]|nr:cytochrome c [Nitrospira sp.]
MFTRVLFSGMVLTGIVLTAATISWAEPTDRNATRKGDAAQGKALFNGKGICHYCHGLDGMIDQKPKLEPETASVVARLSAPAPDLRNRAMLKLKDNKARFRAIREGHSGSGMFPDKTLSDQDITDVLAYLATLRQSAPSPGKSPY